MALPPVPAPASSPTSPAPAQPSPTTTTPQETQTALLPPPVSPPVARPTPPIGDPALIEESDTGPLPIIAPDGRKSWQVYARPFEAPDDLPRIALVISALGMSQAATRAAIQQLPGGVTLAFAPYAERLDEWIRLARAGGHEILLNLPMEPTTFPASDPGPKALLTSLGPKENQSRLNWVLSRFSGYVGVVNLMGSRFTISDEHLRPVLISLRDRGLLFLDSRSAARSRATRLATEVGLPRVINDRFVDSVASRDAIDRRLHQVERIAKRKGAAVAIGFPYPVTIERVARWLPTLSEKGLVLAPVSALVGRQADR
jgi:polysaccharide deacetylase 2 family uncharacterized protein YibQ